MSTESNVFTASELVNFTEDQIWALDDGTNQNIQVKFHDGGIDVPVRRVIYDWYFWEAHRQLPKLPLSVKHHISDRPMDKSTDNEVINRILRDIYYVYGEHDYPKVQASKIVNKIINSLYRITDTRIEEYFTTADIFHVIELMRHEEIISVVKQTKPDRLSLDWMYGCVRKVILESECPILAANPVVISARMGVVPVNQILQLITKRGFITEINSALYPIPEMFNYLEGNYDPTSRLKDSRSGTKALASSKTPLELSEYQGRKLRLLAMYIKRIVKGDCGSRNYVAFNVTESNLEHLDGVWARGDDGEFVIWRDSEELIGTTVYIRNPVNCRHRDNVCERCYGLLHLSVPDDTNIGWSCAAKFSEGISQGTLSLKHLDFNALAKLLMRHLTGETPGYLYTDEKEPTVWKIRADKSRKVSLVLNRSERNEISYDALDNIDLDKVKDLQGIIQFRSVDIFEENAAGIDQFYTEQVGTKSNRCTLTKTFLKYMRIRGYETTERGEIFVNLDRWNHNLPLLAQEFKAENNLDVTHLLGWVYEGRGGGGNAMSFDRAAEKDGNIDYSKSVKQCTTSTEALGTLYNNIAYKIPLHVSVMGVMLKAVRCHSTNHKTGVDYTLPDGDHEFRAGDLKTLLKNRSMGGVLAFEDLPNVMTNTETFSRTYADDHPMDIFITGKE